MPGPHVTNQQKRLFMDFRRHHPQPVAAAKAGFSERTGRRVETSHHPGLFNAAVGGLLSLSCNTGRVNWSN